MPTRTPNETLKEIEAGELAPIYLILGDDDQEKSDIAATFEQAIDQGLRAFNVDRLDGTETTLARLLKTAQTLPMMAPRRLVIVRRFELCLAPKRDNRAGDLDQDVFEEYLGSPYSHASLVLLASGLDKRRRIVTKLLRAATVVNCGVVASLTEADQWIRRRVSAEGRSIVPAAARLMAASVGPNLARLRGDVERLIIYAADQQRIGVDDVQAIVGSAFAHDDWAVARAIERGQVGQALKELSLVLDSGAAPYMVLGQLGWVARKKLPAGRIRKAVEALFRTDLALKRSAGDRKVLLERLVMELCGMNVQVPTVDVEARKTQTD